MTGNLAISYEAEAQCDGIHALLEAAFPTAAESELVDRLRADGDLLLGLVAQDDVGIAGFVAFSQMRAPFVAVGLGPIAVRADSRRQRIGTRLIETGLAELSLLGVEAAFVLGDPAYYARFGFDAQAAAGFDSPYAGSHFMARKLTSARLPATTGSVEYAKAFAALR